MQSAKAKGRKKIVKVKGSTLEIQEHMLNNVPNKAVYK